LIAGLDQPDSGTVLIGGNDVRRLSPRKRNVSMVFQGDAMYPHLTIGASIALSAKAGPTAGRDQRTRNAIELTRLGSIVDRFPDRLSGGELRRAAIAKSIARGAAVRLLDEPLSALDGGVRFELAQDLRRWHDADPGTTIHVTHDGEEAMRLADVIAVLHDGRIEQIGKPNELYDHPRSIAVAMSLGHPPMNLLTNVDQFSGIVGIRPEHLHWSASDDNAKAIMIGRFNRDQVRIAGVEGVAEVSVQRSGRTLVSHMPWERFFDADFYVLSVDRANVRVFGDGTSP
jgi:ABC-type sugar transport system ATPase subunit